VNLLNRLFSETIIVISLPLRRYVAKAGIAGILASVASNQLGGKLFEVTSVTEFDFGLTLQCKSISVQLEACPSVDWSPLMKSTPTSVNNWRLNDDFYTISYWYWTRLWRCLKCNIDGVTSVLYHNVYIKLLNYIDRVTNYHYSAHNLQNCSYSVIYQNYKLNCSFW